MVCSRCLVCVVLRSQGQGQIDKVNKLDVIWKSLPKEKCTIYQIWNMYHYYILYIYNRIVTCITSETIYKTSWSHTVIQTVSEAKRIHLYLPMTVLSENIISAVHTWHNMVHNYKDVVKHTFQRLQYTENCQQLFWTSSKLWVVQDHGYAIIKENG